MARRHDQRSSRQRPEHHTSVGARPNGDGGVSLTALGAGSLSKVDGPFFPAVPLPAGLSLLLSGLAALIGRAASRGHAVLTRQTLTSANARLFYIKTRARSG